MLRRMSGTLSRISAGALIAAAVALTCIDADAQQRVVIVNGQMLNAQELFVLDRLAGGFVPNGNYWLDPYTGAWGFANNGAPIGQMGGNGGGGGADDPMYQGDLDHGPFGTYMSDGRCSFVNGVPVGNCD